MKTQLNHINFTPYLRPLRFGLSVLSLTILVSLVLPATSYAATWNAGHIIDDVIFTHNSSMSAQDIQNFLNSKVPTCDTNGLKPSEYGGGTRAQYAASRGESTPFMCLKNYSEGGRSSAQIIYDTAQQYQINPQVLIVLLQKEQGLVTDEWPWKFEYKTATGYGCPDTAACDSQYFGLTNQLNWSGKMFRSIMDANPNWYTPYVLGNNFIHYSTISSCGGSNVNIENRSTQALYNYTPYQPNQAALDAGYGTASCGAYGNRNFWLYFNNWFGDTLAKSYAWELVGGIYKIYDQTGTTQVDPGFLKPGVKYVVKLSAKNNGTATWINNGPNPFVLGTTYGNSSRFCTATWLACNRPALLKEPSVAPGGVGDFEFTIQAPFTPGTYIDYFKPLAELLSWTNDGPSFGVRVVSGSYQWALKDSVYEIYNAAGTSRVDPGFLEPGQSYLVRVNARNTGTATWENNSPTPVYLATSSPNSRTSALCNNSWIACNRPALLGNSSVAPGDTGIFQFTIKAPYAAGEYREQFKPVAENLAWSNDISQVFGIRVYVGTYLWSTSGYTIKDQSNIQVDPGRLHADQTYTAYITARNTGTATWENNSPTPVYLATSSPNSRTSALCNNSWIACNRPALLQEATVAPGQDGHFQFTFTAPKNTGPYRESFKPVAEFFSWFNDIPPNDSFGIIVIP